MLMSDLTISDDGSSCYLETGKSPLDIGDQADNKPESAAVTPEDLAAAATMPSYFDAGSDEEETQVPVPSKKPTGSTSKSSKKKTDQLETEYKKASDHPDVVNKVEKSRKRGTTEGPEESVTSPKKVCASFLPKMFKLTMIG